MGSLWANLACVRDELGTPILAHERLQTYTGRPIRACVCAGQVYLSLIHLFYITGGEECPLTNFEGKVKRLQCFLYLPFTWTSKAQYVGI